MKKDKLVVYTALFGDYDDLIDPAENFEGCDFICFTDRKDLKSDIWEIKIINEIDLPPNRMNRKYKMFPNVFIPEYNTSLYVDSNIFIKRNPVELLDKYLIRYDIALPKHFARNCVYKEAEEVVKLGKEKKGLAEEQMSFYKKEGFPTRFGLTENNIIFRKHNKKNVIKLMECWWSQINKYSKRDQLSFMYCAWKTSVNIGIMKESARGGKYFKIYPHKNNYENRILGKLIRAKNIYFFNHPNSLLKKIYVTTFSNLKFKD